MSISEKIFGDLEFESELQHAQRKRDEAAIDARIREWNAAVEKACGQIDNLTLPHLREALEAEKKAGIISKQAKKDFAEFKDYLANHGWWMFNALEPEPQAVAAFLISRLNRGSRHLQRLVQNISTFLRAAGQNDPCGDIFIRALLRSVRAKEKADKLNNSEPRKAN